jgi:hypothetical protein
LEVLEVELLDVIEAGTVERPVGRAATVGAAPDVTTFTPDMAVGAATGCMLTFCRRGQLGRAI